MNLLSTQEKLNNELTPFLENSYRSFFIEGPLNCGKNYTVTNRIDPLAIDSEYKIINFTTEEEWEHREYYPFSKGIENLTNFNLTDFIHGSIFSILKDDKVKDRGMLNFIAYLVNNTKKRKEENGMFNEKEKEILAKLDMYIGKHQKCILAFYDLQLWDNYSLDLLLLIIKSGSTRFEFFNNMKIIITYAPAEGLKQKKRIEKIKMLCDKFYKMESLNKADLKKLTSNFFPNLKINDSVISMISKLSKSNISYITTILSELARTEEYTTQMNDGEILDLETILKKRLEELGASGIQVTEVLKYASIIGNSFSSVELGKVTKLNEDKFIEIIQDANDLNLIKNKDREYYNFAHEIIKKIFEVQVQQQQIEYYINLEAILKSIRPSLYLRRARYLVKANKIKQASELFVLAIIKQLREFSRVDDELIIEAKLFIEENQIYYYKQMESIYLLFSDEKYTEAIPKLEKLLTFPSKKLVAEVKILLSQCYIKSLDSRLKEKAIAYLKVYKDISDIEYEQELFERIQFRLLVSYSHFGQKEKGLQCEAALYTLLDSRSQYDETANHKLNNLKRISNALHDCEYSEHVMKDAVTYFAPSENGIPKYLIDYYKALCNCSGAQIMCGNFNESFHTASKAIDLVKDFHDISFPRIQIAINNYLLAGFLYGKLSALECLNSFSNLIEKMHINADRLLFVSNLSIFHSINGQYQEASEVLLNEYKKHAKDEKEGLYDYRVVTNNAIYSFLMGKKTKAINDLKKLSDYLENLTDIEMRRKNELLIEKMKTIETKLDGNQWLHLLVENTNHNNNSTSWKYFGLGYAFTTQYNWDI
ncbi:hypothetical protein MX629_07215 [Carnobacterium divergens]|uniref:Uncharacterized protein n=1 Tax=Carnobacterium divergens TaxID=2748 RepID=A0AAW8R707_CARDV|nr:hypothetical protein [Carnobacterium divergens]MDT1958217.1 hypothetical protein [Carnobacterium divergens]MDT1973484.1 hypothetical protein [Carnobacterium divergens]